MRLFLFPTFASALCLIGCAGSSNSLSPTSATASLAGLHGIAHGGQQPVAHSTIQLYQSGSAGYGAGATALLTSPVLTDASGNFTITQSVNCTSGSQVYYTATGGQPITGTANGALAMIAGLGQCSNLTNATFTDINEVTTVATVWALAPFMSGANIGAPSSNPTGLANAFADINTLVNTTTGAANISTTGVTLPTAEINTIADSIAACINSSGSTTAGSGCSNLFNAAPNANGTSPTDTLTAALNIARNPSRNVMAIINNGVASAPFNPTITSANDLTLAVTYTGGGLNGPVAAAADSSGNIWVANSAGNSITEITHTGTVLSGTSGYQPSGLSAPSAIAVDLNGHVWITNAGTSTVSELSASGANVGNSPFSGGGLSSPSGIAFDAFGNSWISNSGSSSVSEFSSTGSPLSGSGFSVSGLTAPVGVAVNPH